MIVNQGEVGGQKPGKNVKINCERTLDKTIEK